MSAVKPRFFDRVAGAFTAASIAFLPGFFLMNISGGFSGHVHPLSRFGQVTDSVGLILGIILISIFLIAYPVERWLVKPEQSIWRIIGTYSWVIVLVGMALNILSFLFSWGTYSAVIFIATPIALITAAVGRALYDHTKIFIKANRIVASFLALLIAAAIALPDFSQISYRVSNFYPVTQPGEISRGTWDVNETDGSAGTHFERSGLRPVDGVDYVIKWDCQKPAGQDYRIYVQEATDYKFSEEIDVTCTPGHETKVAVGTDIANQEIKVMIGPIGENQQPVDSDAYAILVPAT